MGGGQFCCVPFCAATKGKCRGISFHRFPKDKKKIKLWLIKIRRDVGPAFQLRPWTSVCSRHFSDDSFRANSHEKSFIRYLKADAIPTKFEWNDWGEVKKRKAPSIRAPSALTNHKTGLKLTQGHVHEPRNVLDQHLPNVDRQSETVESNGINPEAETHQKDAPVIDDIRCPTDLEWEQALVHSVKRNREDPGFNEDTALTCSELFHERCFKTIKINTGKRYKKFLIPGSIPTELMPRISMPIESTRHSQMKSKETDEAVCEETTETSTMDKKPLNFTEELRKVIKQETLDEDELGVVKTELTWDHNLYDINKSTVPECFETKELKTELKTENDQQNNVDRNGDKQLTCGLCGEIFTNKFSLQHHQLVHNGEIRFDCEICHKRFSTFYTLKDHQLVHSGVQAHKCDLCPMEFSQLLLLKRHLKTHSERKSYQCKICHTFFSVRSSLEKHSLVHTGVKDV